MAITVSFVSEKGGTGKTTSTYHIAVALQRFHNKRVMVLDADYQRGGISGRFFPDYIENFGGNLGSSVSLYNKYQQLYSDSVFTSDVSIRSWNDEIDVIVADPRLSTVSADKLPSSNNIRENNSRLLSHLRVIKRVLEPVDNRYDYILIDSHPEVSEVLRSVIYASDFCVSPVKLDRQSSIGVATILGEIENVNADVESFSANDHSILKETKFSGSIGMMAREYSDQLKDSERIEYNRLRRTGGIFSCYVTEGDGLRRAAAERIPVYDVQGANAARQSDQFKALTVEFLAKCS